MNVVIEVAAASGFADMAVPSTVKAILGICKVAIVETKTVAASILRAITNFGRTSLSAVAPDHNSMILGGVAV